MEGAPPRITSVTLEAADHAYGPLGGTVELRSLIAAHYNRLYRVGKASQYTADNVSVACGGRLALTRVFSALGRTRIGYQVPEYTGESTARARVDDRVLSLVTLLCVCVCVSARACAGCGVPACGCVSV
jgi:aspartate/methionine/tyrosine aminotransferase